MTLNGLINHIGLWRRAEHLAYCQIERTNTISLLESKAIIWNPSGRYSIDYDKTWQALETLGAKILDMQAHGDVEGARAWIKQYGVAGPESLSDKRVLENAGIPVDIRFTYE